MNLISSARRRSDPFLYPATQTTRRGRAHRRRELLGRGGKGTTGRRPVQPVSASGRFSRIVNQDQGRPPHLLRRQSLGGPYLTIWTCQKIPVRPSILMLTPRLIPPMVNRSQNLFRARAFRENRGAWAEIKRDNRLIEQFNFQQET